MYLIAIQIGPVDRLYYQVILRTQQFAFLN